MPEIPSAGRLLALDWGEIRFGLALSDERQVIASPLETLSRRAGKRFPMPRFLELIVQHQPVGLIVGLPLSLEGNETPSSSSARELAQTVARRTSLPLELVDERLTTSRALRTIKEQGGSTRGKKEEVDALAAAILLQGFIDGRRGSGQ